jgi:hypothetical protein
MGIWESPERFFSAGGTRDWASLLSTEDISHFEGRLNHLAGDAAAWAITGRAALAKPEPGRP